MEPTLRPGDWLLVWRGTRRDRPVRVRPGQLVVARNPEQPEMLLVKRATWLDDGGWWLDSDNPRAGAVDSARFGPVRPDFIEGRVIGRYLPVRD
jgi:nickel-type superoxide dismutase maturation protease